MNGLLTHTDIHTLIEEGRIGSSSPIDPAQIQPTSLDLRLSAEGYRIQSGFLPERVPVSDRLRDVRLYDLDLERGTVLEKGQIYLIRLDENLDLPPHIQARANPKSSTGRIDVFTRLVTDGCDHFDDVRMGYQGPLYLEVVPRSFPILVRQGSRLNQIRFNQGDTSVSDADLEKRILEERLVSADDGTPLEAHELSIRDGLRLTLDLGSKDDPDRIVGYRARVYTSFIDVDARQARSPIDYWEPIRGEGRESLVLRPEEFYLFASKERIRIPRDLAGEMVAYDVSIGELRTNYAGFFDPGFGWVDGSTGSKAVLEVRAHDVPFLVDHGQTVCRLTFEQTMRPCEFGYGASSLHSSYQGQVLALSKHFVPLEESALKRKKAAPV